MLMVTASVLKLDSVISVMRTGRESYHVLTTNNGDVGLDTCPDKDMSVICVYILITP